MLSPSQPFAEQHQGKAAPVPAALPLSRSLQGAAEAVTAGGHSAEAELDRRASAV